LTNNYKNMPLKVFLSRHDTKGNFHSIPCSLHVNNSKVTLYFDTPTPDIKLDGAIGHKLTQLVVWNMQEFTIEGSIYIKGFVNINGGWIRDHFCLYFEKQKCD